MSQGDRSYKSPLNCPLIAALIVAYGSHLSGSHPSVRRLLLTVFAVGAIALTVWCFVTIALITEGWWNFFDVFRHCAFEAKLCFAVPHSAETLMVSPVYSSMKSGQSENAVGPRGSIHGVFYVVRA